LTRYGPRYQTPWECFTFQLNVRLVVQEEHVTVVAEPGGEYVTHFTPSSGKSLDIFRELHSVACEYEAEVCILGCDGTNVNTSVHSGI